jgi:hypothetical protein
LLYFTCNLIQSSLSLSCYCRQFLKFVAVEPDFFLDTKELDQENPEIRERPVIFGPKFAAQRLYQLSPKEVREP